MGQMANKMVVDALDKLAKGDSRKKNIISAVLYVFLLLLVITAIIYSTGAEKRSAVRIGYVGNATSHTWTGNYVSLNGEMSKNLNVKNGNITVDITTEKGSIDILIEDSKGEKLYKGTNLETCSFNVGGKGKVKVTINADHHSGSFSFVTDK